MNKSPAPPKPLVDAKIYPGTRRRGRYVRLLVFVTKREMLTYLRSVRAKPGDASAMCLCFEEVSGSRRGYEIVFSAGFSGRPANQIAHECLHATMRLCTRRQLEKVLEETMDEKSGMGAGGEVPGLSDWSLG